MNERRRPKVLVVEDDPDELELFGSLLDTHGFDVTLVSTVEEGLAALAKDEFAFVLADYNLPDGTGTSMIRRARELGALDGTPTFLATAYPYPDKDPETVLLKKPVDVPTLVRAAHDAARRHKG